jgi:outer membrane protein assembly factor BamA
MRVMHVGRYGSGAEDQRLLPLSWTLRDLVRGYGDTGPVLGDTSYLTAPRLLVANVEARFPIPGIFTGSAEPLGLPIEGLIFSDAGQFWIPSLANSARPILRSYGGGVRITAAGFIFEFDAVRPVDLDPVARGWKFAFNFRPGF